MLDTVKLDVGAGILGNKNPVSRFNLQRNAFAVFSHFTGTGRNDFTSLRFFFGRIGDDDPAGTFLFFFLSDDKYPVI
mgnify:CR=1 FL=1